MSKLIGRPPRPPRERFETKFRIDEYGCHVWTAGLKPNGYGQFQVVRGRGSLAHRVAWELYVGPIPPGKYVLHDCQSHGAPRDNKACVNPAHLWLGTQDDNVADRDKKGNTAHQRGEANGYAKLTTADVVAARYAYVMFGTTHHELATALGVNKDTMRLVLKGKTWKHV